MSAYNFGGSGPTLTKLYQVTWHEAGVIKWTLILQGVPPTKSGRAKNVQNLARFLTTFEFDREYLRNRSTYRKSESTWSTKFPPLLDEERLVNFGPLTKKVYRRSCWLTQVDFFWNTKFRLLGGAGPSNFYTPYNSLKCISSRTWGAGWPHVGLCPIFLVIFVSVIVECYCYCDGPTLLLVPYDILREDAVHWSNWTCIVLCR